MDDVVTLARIALPEGHPDGEDLPSLVATQQGHVEEARSRLTSLRIEIAHEAAGLHTLYRKAIETSIRILEQTIHGSVSRGTKAKAEYLATVAEGMDRKLRIQHNQLLAQTKSPEIEDILQSRQEDLDQESALLRRKLRELEGRLDEYRQAKAVEGIAKEYAEIISETKKVQSDIERFQRGR